MRRFGLGWTIVGVALLAGIGCLLFPLAAGPLVFAMPVLAAAQFLSGFSIMMYNINQISLRQILVPARLQGRMNASIRFIIWGAIPIGLLCGGFLGEAIGLRLTLVVGGAGAVLSFLWVFFSPLQTLQTPQERVQPAQAKEPERV